MDITSKLRLHLMGCWRLYFLAISTTLKSHVIPYCHSYDRTVRLNETYLQVEV